MTFLSSLVSFSSSLLINFRYYQNSLLRTLFSPFISIPKTTLKNHKILILGDRLASGYGDLSTNFGGQGGISSGLQILIDSNSVLRQNWYVYNCGIKGSTIYDWNYNQWNNSLFQRIFHSNSPYSDAEFIILFIGHENINKNNMNNNNNNGNNNTQRQQYEESGNEIVKFAIHLNQLFPEKYIFIITPLCPPNENNENNNNNNKNNLKSPKNTTNNNNNNNNNMKSLKNKNKLLEYKSNDYNNNNNNNINTNNDTTMMDNNNESIGLNSSRPFTNEQNHMMNSSNSSLLLQSEYESNQLYRNSLIVNQIRDYIHKTYPLDESKLNETEPEIDEIGDAFPLDRPSKSANSPCRIQIILDTTIFPGYYHNPDVYSNSDHISLTSTGYRCLSRDLFQYLLPFLTKLEWKTWPLILDEQAKEKRKKKYK